MNNDIVGLILLLVLYSRMTHQCLCHRVHLFNHNWFFTSNIMMEASPTYAMIMVVSSPDDRLQHRTGVLVIFGQQ